jgi:hypothetical protein
MNEEKGLIAQQKKIPFVMQKAQFGACLMFRNMQERGIAIASART